MNDHIKIDRICDLFLQTINQYGELEKRLHVPGHELGLAEIHTIVDIGGHEGQNITALALRQGVSKSAVSQMVSKLVKKGYVLKNTSPETDNEVVLELTAAGKEVHMEHEKQHQGLRKQLAIIFAKYPPKTMDTLAGLATDIQALWKELL